MTLFKPFVVIAQISISQYVMQLTLISLILALWNLMFLLEIKQLFFTFNPYPANVEKIVS
jgi:hypothetical protein